MATDPPASTINHTPEVETLMRKKPVTLTVKETSELAGLGLRQTYAAIHAGEIPSVRLGNRLLVPRAALMRLLNGDDAPAA